MNINEYLKNYIENNILTEYSLNESGHRVDHIEYVIKRSLEFARKVKNINLNMVYVVAAFHDIGHHINADKHEIISAQILYNDKNIRNYFSDLEIKIMCEAIEDHRASLKGKPRNIYGKIVSAADRNTSVNVTLKRCFSYNTYHYPDLCMEEQIERCREFLLNKFGNNGYARNKMYFDDKEYKNYLIELTRLCNDKIEFSDKIRKANGII